MKIAIASGKGGTGKTTLATNLAAYLVQSRAVSLVDMDVEAPNSGLFIPGEASHSERKFKNVPVWQSERCSLCGECQKICQFHAILNLGKQILVFPELCHSCYACSELCPDNALPMVKQEMGTLNAKVNENLNFVESRLDIGQEQAVPLIAQTHDFIDETFPAEDLVIIDAPPGTNCPVIETVKSVDYVILVTEPTPFGLHDLKIAVDTMIQLKKPFGVVINKFGIGNDEVLDYCRNNDIDILAKLPNQRKIAELYSSGQLLFQQIPEFAAELKKIAEFISKIETGIEYV